MDDKPGPKCLLLLIGLILLPLTGRGELCCSFDVLPVSGKVYIRDDARCDWATNLFCYPERVSILWTERYAVTGPVTGEKGVSQIVHYASAAGSVVDHDTPWWNFKKRYNEEN